MLGSSSQDSVKNAHRDRSGKVPHWCGCGLRPILRWSGTDSNPERSFYGCSNYNTTGKRWCDFFKWADVEEEEVILVKTIEKYLWDEKLVQLKLKLEY
ncbi:hypothetical protein Ahy_B04g069370 [Arachis hypogaea]|uniref:GRF-type domain-containing protein n=1 Tax=Arachis hypogaea TaxID=3818 RepID=A0A444ZCD9_ARAHY|nr:hypothetical protein Ahy_B04g069370 [Arachis hypogaea]